LRKYPSLKTDFQKMIVSLEETPLMGTAPGNDFYKISIKITSKGKGKSGGGRLITCVKIVKETVYLAAIYDKSEKQTFSDAVLKLLVKQIG